MEWKEFELHSARRQVVKTTGHLINARKELLNTIKHNKGFTDKSNPTTSSIEMNIKTLLEGLQETIKFCAKAAEDFKSQMKDPDAIPPPIQGGYGKQLSPMQRQMALQGIKFETMAKFEPTKRELRTAEIDFHLNLPKQKKRERITRDNPPIC